MHPNSSSDRLAFKVRQHMTHQSHTRYTNAANKTAVSEIVQYTVSTQLNVAAVIEAAIRQ